MWGGQKIIFSKHVHFAYQIERDDKRNRTQVGSNWWPWDGVKGHISLSFNFNDFYTKLCVIVFSQIKDIKHIRIFILLPGLCPMGGMLGAVKNFRVGICDLFPVIK